MSSSSSPKTTSPRISKICPACNKEVDTNYTQNDKNECFKNCYRERRKLSPDQLYDYFVQKYQFFLSTFSTLLGINWFSKKTIPSKAQFLKLLDISHVLRRKTPIVLGRKDDKTWVDFSVASYFTYWISFLNGKRGVFFDKWAEWNTTKNRIDPEFWRAPSGKRVADYTDSTIVPLLGAYDIKEFDDKSTGKLLERLMGAATLNIIPPNLVNQLIKHKKDLEAFQQQQVEQNIFPQKNVDVGEIPWSITDRWVWERFEYHCQFDYALCIHNQLNAQFHRAEWIAHTVKREILCANRHAARPNAFGTTDLNTREFYRRHMREECEGSLGLMNTWGCKNCQHFKTFKIQQEQIALGGWANALVPSVFGGFTQHTVPVGREGNKPYYLFLSTDKTHSVGALRDTAQRPPDSAEREEALKRRSEEAKRRLLEMGREMVNKANAKVTS